MRLLWVTRGGSDDADAGDTIYDRKISAALATSHQIETVAAPRGGRLAQLARAGLNLSAPETFGFDLQDTVARVAEAVSGRRPDAIVFSHEHLDRLAAAVRTRLGDGAPPLVTIRHNLTSDMMASFFADAPPAAALYRTLAQRQERAALRPGLFKGVVALSVRDRALIARLSGRSDIALAMPGAPPPLPLAPDARMTRDVLLLGTYDWFPKARDLRRFADGFALRPAPGARVHTDTGVPAAITAQLGAAPSRALDLSAAMRFGVVTDRFTAGHKLKTSAYLMQNCMVVSFADVIEDFQTLPHAARWIHRVRSTDEIGPLIDAAMARPADELRAELTALKAAIVEAVAWRRSADAIAEAITRAVV